MDIGQAIAMLRQKKKLSQTEFAKLIDLTQASLSHIESGKKKPRKATIGRICEVLQIPEQFLFLLILDESNLADSSKDNFRLIGKELKELILESI